MRQFFCIAGFTLMEMLVVLFIIGLTATITMDITPQGAKDPACYEETLRVMDQIELAVLGVPPRHLAGEHRFTGYVAHMGELPELLGQTHQPAGLWTWRVADEHGAENNLTRWHYTGDHSRLWMGWRGPYIEDRAGTLRDGWGHALRFSRFNVTEPGQEEEDPKGMNLRVISLGANGLEAASRSEEEGYDTDIERVIREEQYMGYLSGQSGTEVGSMDIFYPVKGEEETSTVPQPAPDGYFQVPIPIPVGTRSMRLTGGSGRTILFSMELTENWLGKIQ